MRKRKEREDLCVDSIVFCFTAKEEVLEVLEVVELLQGGGKALLWLLSVRLILGAGSFLRPELTYFFFVDDPKKEKTNAKAPKSFLSVSSYLIAFHLSSR